MDSFKEKLLRLKNELKISTDKEVAAVLGMKPTAFAERKKTNSFPDKQIFELAKECPELDIDYILLGHRRKTYEAMEKDALKDMPKADFSDKTGLLVQLFLQCDDQGRAAILSVAQTMAAMGQATGVNIAQQFNGNTISGGNFTVKNK